MSQIDKVQEQIAYLGAKSPVALTALRDGRGRTGKQQRAQIRTAYEEAIAAAGDNEVAGGVPAAQPVWLAAIAAMVDDMKSVVSTEVRQCKEEILGTLDKKVTEVQSEVSALHSTVGCLAERLVAVERWVAAQESTRTDLTEGESEGGRNKDKTRRGVTVDSEGGTEGSEGMGMGKGQEGLQVRVTQLALEQRLSRAALQAHGEVQWRPTAAGTAAKKAHWDALEEEMRLKLLIAQRSGITSNTAALAAVKKKLESTLIDNTASSAGVVRIFKDLMGLSSEQQGRLTRAEKLCRERASSEDDEDDEGSNSRAQRRRVRMKRTAGEGLGGGGRGSGRGACYLCGEAGHIAVACPDREPG
jgi:uncharacterized coiled-coil protein SlyX